MLDRTGLRVIAKPTYLVRLNANKERIFDALCVAAKALGPDNEAQRLVDEIYGNEFVQPITAAQTGEHEHLSAPGIPQLATRALNAATN